MLVKLFRANYFYNFILFPLVGLALLTTSFVLGDHLNLLQKQQPNFYLFPFYNAAIPYQLAIGINFFVVMLIGIELLHLNSRFTFSNERTFLPVYLYMFIVYAFTEFHVIQPALFSTLFLVWTLRILFASFEKRTAIDNAFNAGFFIGIASLFQIQLALMTLLIPFSMVIIRKNVSWRELVTPFLGAVLPWMLYVSYFYISNNFESLQSITDQYFNVKISNWKLQWPVMAYIAFLVVMIATSNIVIFKQYGVMNIAIRRYYKVFALFFGFSLLLLLIALVPNSIVVFMAVPLSFLFTNFFVNNRSKFWSELFMIILLVMAFTLQFIR
jgi:hypothetical protein